MGLMPKLNKPTHSAKDAFEISISRVRNADLKARLVAATDVIVAISADYELAGPLQNLHLIPRTMPVAAVTKDEMEAVYTQRMAGLRGPARPIYGAPWAFLQ